MLDFDAIINGIRRAIYGREVREYIALAIQWVKEFVTQQVEIMKQLLAQAKTAAENAAKSAAAAKTSETNAKKSETAAKTSETNAATSAAKAKSEADRAEENADKTMTLIKEGIEGYKGGYYRTYELTLPVSGWKALSSPVGVSKYFCDMAVDKCNADLIPFGSTKLENYRAAITAGMAAMMETLEGKVRFYAVKVPTEAIDVTVTLLAKGSATAQPASRTELGLVKIGDGLDIEADGTVSGHVPSDTEMAELTSVLAAEAAADTETEQTE